MFYEKDLVEKNLTCMNCMRRYNVPKLLPCGSVICDCYKTSLVYYRASKGYIKCPFCKYEHEIPSHGFPIMRQLLNLLNLEPVHIHRHSVKTTTTPEPEPTPIVTGNEAFSKLNSNINAIIEMTNRLHETINSTQVMIKNHFEGLRTRIENNRLYLVDQLEQYKNDLFLEIALNENEYMRYFKTASGEIETTDETESASKWFEVYRFLFSVREKVKSFKRDVEIMDATGGDSSSCDTFANILNETEMIKTKLDKYCKSFDKIFFSTSKILIYKEPATLVALSQNETIDESINRNIVLSEEIYGSILGKIEYQDFNYLAHTGILSINRLQTKFLPKILNYKSYEPVDQNYRLLGVLVAPFLDLKIVSCSYRMMGISNHYYDVNLKLFDYTNDFLLINESWEMKNCHLCDMITFEKSIVLSIRNEFSIPLVQIYNQSLQVVRSIEHSYRNDASLFVNSDFIYLIDTNSPFIHVYDWNLSEVESFGQNSSPSDAHYISLDDKLLIKFNKYLTIDVKNYLIRVYSLREGKLLREIDLKGADVPTTTLTLENRILVTLDNEEKLIVTSRDKKHVYIYDSIENETESKLVYKHDISEIATISSISITNEGLLMIHDANDKLIYLY